MLTKLMRSSKLYGLMFLLASGGLACAGVSPTVEPLPTNPPVEQLVFEVQTATSTLIPMRLSTFTPTPSPTSTPLPVDLPPTSTLTPTLVVDATADFDEATPEPTAEADISTAPEPTTPPTAPPVVERLPMQIGGEWDFEAGFGEWRNPHGDNCPEGMLGVGWGAFTTRDQFGSSCMNRTTFGANVYIGEAAQEITFAFVGSEAGIYKTTPTIAGHQYVVEAFVKREFSPAKVEVTLGIDLTGGQNWQAETVTWFPWQNDVDDEWAQTQQTVLAEGEQMTIFIKGNHPFPEGGGALRIDSIFVRDEGLPE